MRTVRRLYFYLVAFISAEVIVWGTITLARTLLNAPPGGGTVNLLASGLSLVLVGIPIFLIHWLTAQRDAARDEEEHASRLRGIFLYGIRLAVLLPVVQNVWAIVLRLLLRAFDLPLSQAMVGAGQSLSDNLVAPLVLLIAYVYFERVLRADWQAALPEADLAGVRRLYRYVWVIYSLTLALTGVHFALRFIFSAFNDPYGARSQLLANGLALIVVGVPLWVWCWRSVQNALHEPGERPSLLRLGVLFILTLGGVLSTLAAGGVTLAGLLRWALGEPHTLPEFLELESAALATAITLGMLWAYYGRHLAAELRAIADPLRRAALERFYASLLALAGNAATFFGVWKLLSVLVDWITGKVVPIYGLRDPLATGLATLAVGLPLWLRIWPKLQAEAARLDEQGDHARRSVVRKGYLYLVLFATVAGAMTAAGMLFFLVLNSLLGNPTDAFWTTFLQRLQTLVMVALWLAYHLSALRRDGQQAQRVLSDQHAAFPVLIIQSEADGFGSEVLAAIQRQSPRVPAAVHTLGEAPLSDELSAARAVVLPADLAARPPEALRLWLKEYSGTQIVVPLPVEGWIWLGATTASTRVLARGAAQAVRQLAEGQPVKVNPPAGPWTVVGYVLGVLFGVELLFMLFGMVMSFIGSR